MEENRVSRGASNDAPPSPKNHRIGMQCVLVSPSGEKYVVDNMTDWGRKNYRLFEPGSTDPEATAARIQKGFAAVAASIRGTRKDVSRYKGWKIDSVLAKGQDYATPQSSLRNYKRVDITGQRFGRLVAMHPTDKRSGGSIVWHCQCDCGNTSDVSARALMHDGTESCGCMRKDSVQDSLKRQGKTPGISYSKKVGEYIVNRTYGVKNYYIGKRKTIEGAIALRDEVNRVPDDEFLEWLADYRRSRKGRKMTDKQYSTCVSETQNYADRDAYISDLSLSDIWGDSPNDSIPQSRIKKLGNIYDAAHRTVKEIAAASGLSVRAMAIRFCIPQRTIESWCSDGESGRQCPLYTLLMMQECLGMLTR